MLSWFRPTCPCDAAAKRWVESRLQWLSKQFGLHILLERPIILPTSEFFPDPWDGSKKAAQRLFNRVCEYMGLEPDGVKLEFFENKQDLAMVNERGHDVPTSAAGWYRDGHIEIDTNGLDRPMDLVGTMAHELAHQRLLGEGRIDHEVFDSELLTDLTVVFHGLGVFMANFPRAWRGQMTYWPGTELWRPEYMSEPMFGYALAHLAWFRDKESPAWAKHLRWAPRGTFKQGLRYLQKTGDSSFRPVRYRETLDPS
jgi:hypothetical protein